MFSKILKMNHQYSIGLLIVSNERVVNKFERQCRVMNNYPTSALDMR